MGAVVQRRLELSSRISSSSSAEAEGEFDRVVLPGGFAARAARGGRQPVQQPGLGRDESLPRRPERRAAGLVSIVSTRGAIDILVGRLRAAVRRVRTVLVLWDAHGFEIAETRARANPAAHRRPRAHLLLMHDISDNRYRGGAAIVRVASRCGKDRTWEKRHGRLAERASTSAG